MQTESAGAGTPAPVPDVRAVAAAGQPLRLRLDAPHPALRFVEVRIPADTLPAGEVASLTIDTEHVKIVEGRWSGVRILLQTQTVAYENPVDIEIGVPEPEKRLLPVPYGQAEDGGLELLQIIELDQSDARFTIGTWQPVIATWVYVSG